MKKNFFNNLFEYKEESNYEFILPENSNNIDLKEFDKKDTHIVSSNLKENKEYLKIKFNMLINSDIKIREFTINIKPKKYSAFIIYIDGMVSDEAINNFILKPLLLKNSIKMKAESSEIIQKNF